MARDTENSSTRTDVNVIVSSAETSKSISEHSIINGYSTDSLTAENTNSNNVAGSANSKRFFQTRRQLIVFVILIFGNFCSAACFALQAPFFPNEAEKKGATPTQYGFVFGVYQLTVFIVSPFYGKIMAQVTPKFILDMGIFVMAISSLLFAFLAYCPGGMTFVTLAMAIRIAEGAGSAAYTTASATIVTFEFPGREATTYGSVKTAFGVGIIAGPTIGGALYELGGFPLPFITIGIILLLCTVITAIFLPQTEKNPHDRLSPNISVLKFYFHPSIFVNAITIFVFYMSLGYNHVSLEPHLRKTLNMTPFVVGLVFVASGGIYGIMAPLWGWLCDKGVNPKLIGIMGIVLVSINFLLMAPAPFLHIKLKLWIAFCSMLLFGLGAGAALVSCFADCLKGVTKRGYPNNISTLGLISAMYTGSAAMGAFVGPTLGGYLVEKYSFQEGTILIHSSLLLLFVIIILYMCYDKYWKKFCIVNADRQHILKEHSSSIQVRTNEVKQYGTTENP